MDSLIASAHAHGVKTILSLGGAGQCDGFAPMASNKQSRALFIHNVKTFVLARNFDGVDIDWEYSATPAAADTAAYTHLILDLRDSLGKNLLLTAALPSDDWWAKWFSAQGFMSALDWAGIMTYDFTGDWDTQTEYNSPLYANGQKATYSVSQSMQYWNTTRGVDKSKLLGGIPFYGVLFSASKGPGLAFTGSANEISYQDTQDSLLHGSWTTHWDDTAKVPWAESAGGEYMTYENPTSIGLKAQWLANNGYPGVIIWELSEDYSAQGANPLLDTLAAGLGLASSTAVRTPTSHQNFMLTQTATEIRIQGQGLRAVELLDLQGNVVREGRVAGEGASVSLQGAAPGLAVLRILDASGWHGKKVIVN
jgi:chitinase